jgi:hypothetical protein
MIIGAIGMYKLGLVVLPILLIVFILGYFVGKSVGYKNGRKDFRGF